MRSLFLKIFLWFWLSQLLMLAAFAFAQRQWAEPPALPAAAAMRALADDAAELIANGDRQALADWLSELNQGSLRFYLLDAQGRDLGGRRLPRERARMIVDGGGHVAHARHHKAQPLQLGGQRYVLAAVRPYRSRFGELPAWARPAIAASVSGAVCLLLAAAISRPIRRVRQAAALLSGGELSARVEPEPRGADELAQLGRDFNAMAARLQALLESQSQLLRDVSHELRSPLARLQVALELARQRAGNAAAGELDRIETEAERLNELIAQVLMLARMEALDQPARRASISLTDLCEEIVADAAFEAGQAGRRVVMSESTPLQVAGDPVQLRSAIENVVRNALRHTPERTQVEVSLRRSGAMALVTVRDHGPGLAESEIERIFQPFVRVSAARERDTGGYGLGLAIARRSIELHGGRISARNAAGGGLEVVIGLPAL